MNVKRIPVAGILVFCSPLMLAMQCGSFGPPVVEEAFRGRPLPELRKLTLPGGRILQLAETGNPSGPLVLLVHGSPGAWNDYAHVMADAELAKSALLVSVDRMGWGGSAEGGLDTSLEEQAGALRFVLQQYRKNLPAIVVGHSYGGPVAAKLAMDAPGLVGNLIIVAGSIDPALEETAWFQQVSRWMAVRWAVPEILIRADEEIKPLKGELVKLEPGWGRLKMPVLVIQGESDGLVPPANADFAERMITSAEVTIERIPGQGHLIPWERPDLIVDSILNRISLR